MEGLPSPEEEIQNARYRFEKLWWKEQIFVLEPRIKVRQIPPDRYRDGNLQRLLPPVTYAAWLDSAPMDPKQDGSLLVVLWFDDEPGGRSFHEILYPALRGIDWERHARDYQI